MQKAYGKTASEIHTLVEGFASVLSRFDLEDVQAAFKLYILRHSDVPSPSDIANIIEPPVVPLSPALFVSLRKRIAEGYFPLSDERAFLRAFEEQEMAKVRGGSDLLRDCQRQITEHSRRVQLTHEADE